MNKKQKLELTWIGKENRPKLEPRILLEDTEKSYHAAHRVADKDIFDNRLIFGDNLLAHIAVVGARRCLARYCCDWIGEVRFNMDKSMTKDRATDNRRVIIKITG